MDIHNLIRQIASEEAQAQSTPFLAPCVRGGQVRTRISGLIRSYQPDPESFEGWGIFLPQDPKTARVIEEATAPQIEAYLKLLTPLRVILVSQLRGSTWLAYPAHQETARQVLPRVQPLPAHWVESGDRFEQIRVAWDGQTCWFQEIDRQVNPQLAEAMRESLQQLIQVAGLRLKELTPEHRVAYELATQGIEGFVARSQAQQDRERLRQALALGGGMLQHHQDQGDYWLVTWHTADGQHHHSAIQKSDLTVIGAGICLSGRDRDFDLQSLVGVVEGA